VGEAPAQLQGYQGHDLHRLAGTGGLLYQHITRSATNMRHQPRLIGPQGLAVHRQGKASNQGVKFPQL
jgi:hypothetical protein